MSYQDKLERADNHLKVLGLSCNTDKTIVYRFLRNRGIQLKPVYWESLPTNIVLKFIEFFFVYLFITYLFSLAQENSMFMDTLTNALITSSAFSIAISIYYLIVARRKSLIKWEKV
ncbi:DUF6404 family protein [Vibrio minamisatsumaniensis]|uniref:DUF6404 family protein n=1 Tax=Vibrio minamisatsumaniensis TaxID=2910243 RepID=UPI003D235832